MTSRRTRSSIIMIAMMICTGHACAQSAVTMYGRVNTGMVNYSGYGAGRGAVTQQNNLSSRLGFKGREDLGDGLNALFVIESGFSSDTGAGALGSRETSIGLQGPFGRVKFGFMLTALDDLHSIAGPGYLTNVTNDNLNGFWANGFSNMFNNNNGVGSSTDNCASTIAGNHNASNKFSFDNRYGNSIRYDTPSMGGFRFATHVGLAEIMGCNAYAWSNALQYKANDVQLALAYNLHHNLRGKGLDDHIIMLAGGYNIGAQGYIGAYYQTLRYANPGQNALTQDGFGLVGRRYLGPHTIELGWYHAGQGKGDQTPIYSGISIGNGSQSNLLILGYRYAMSKRTELWSQLAQLRNGSKAQYDFGGTGPVPGEALQGRHLRAIAAGIKHDF